MEIIKKLESMYPQGTMFYSATGLLKTVCFSGGGIRRGENQPHLFYCKNKEGVVYDEKSNIFAEII